MHFEVIKIGLSLMAGGHRTKFENQMLLEKMQRGENNDNR